MASWGNHVIVVYIAAVVRIKGDYYIKKRVYETVFFCPIPEIDGMIIK